MPSTRIRQRLRSLGSSVRVPGVGQPLRTPEGTARAQVRKVVESLKPATAVVAGVGRVLLVDLARAEANVRRAFRAGRAAVLPLGVVGNPAKVGEPPVEAVVGEQEREMRDKRNGDDD